MHSEKKAYPKINYKEKSITLLNKDKEEIKVTVKKKKGSFILLFESRGGRYKRGVPHEKKLERVQQKTNKKR